jgi:hypothetical protein
MHVTLEQILTSTRDRLAGLHQRRAAVEREAASAARAPSFAAALRRDRVAVIAEVKRRSPSAGAIREDLDPADRAGRYAGHGAAAISVLTDGPFFGGSVDDLRAAAARVAVPVLRKDFILDELQSLAPSRTNEINSGHYVAGGKLQFNVERLRSEKIRIGGAMQGWTKVRYGVRSALMWVGAKTGARFTKDEPTLARFNHLWNNLKVNQLVIVDRNRKWRGILETPFYCDGADLWEVRYYGKLKTKHQEQKDDDLILEAA